MYKSITLLSMLVLVLGTPALGQITVTTNDFMPTPGTAIKNRNDISFNQAFFDSLASGSGGPTTWDFSSRSYGTGYVVYSVNLATAPAIDSFPDANLVTLTPAGADSSWVVYNSTPNLFEQLGTVSHVSSAEYVDLYYDIAPEWVFPFTYNSSWTGYRHANEPSVFTYSITYDTTHAHVNAWGMAKRGSNSVPCLRVISDERRTVRTFDSSDVFLDSTITEITTISFVAEGFDILVSAVRITSPFTTTYSCTASDSFVNSATDVEEIDTGSLPAGFELSQNYPNPFNPSTEIRLSVPTSSHVTLTVFNVLGREVKSLMDQTLAAGSYVVGWDGRNQDGRPVASGVYFYRMTTDQYISTKKMVLLK